MNRYVLPSKYLNYSQTTENIYQNDQIQKCENLKYDEAVLTYLALITRISNSIYRFIKMENTKMT